MAGMNRGLHLLTAQWLPGPANRVRWPERNQDLATSPCRQKPSSGESLRLEKPVRWPEWRTRPGLVPLAPLGTARSSGPRHGPGPGERPSRQIPGTAGFPTPPLARVEEHPAAKLIALVVGE